MNVIRKMSPSGSEGAAKFEKNNARLKKPISPAQEYPRGLETPKARSKVIVKFRDIDLLPKGSFPVSELLAQHSVDAAKRVDGIELKPHFKADALKRVEHRFTKVISNDHKGEWPKLEAYRDAVVNNDEQGEWLALQLRALDNVTTAYLHPGVVEPPLVYADDDVLAADQHYLDPAPWGIDARYAWTVAGGDGKNQRLADIEYGWNLGHEDLAGNNFTNIARGFYQSLAHGTKVLGVIAAQDNNKLCVGITPNLASIVTVGQWRSNDDPVTDDAIFDAILELDVGDVMLLEAQTDMFGYENIPLEAEPAVFDLVWVATYLGIVVVAAAGNGGVDLDTVVDDDGVRIFDLDVRDSGAIIVGSAWPHTQEPQWIPLGSSCYGNRVDCFACGDGVVTLSSDYWGDRFDEWSNNFYGTSAASAIVAGAALALQGVAQENYGTRLGPDEMRKKLSAPAFNTHSQNGVSDGIGVMPDLLKIIGSLP